MYPITYPENGKQNLTRIKRDYKKLSLIVEHFNIPLVLVPD